MTEITIKGFIHKPKLTTAGDLYRGRITCPNVQWTGEDKEAFATFTVTAEQVADAAENTMLWTDQNVQRGIKPGLLEQPPRILRIADGYPSEKYYIFDATKADDIVEKLLAGEQLFLNPLIWNLRPGNFRAYWENKSKHIHIYQGQIFLPDSHHRHQAILKAVRTYNESPASFPKFNLEKQFKIELYFLNREDEGNYFFDKNQRPKPVAKSKAYDLTTQDDLSVLAKRVVEKSTALKDNVNRVTDRLSAGNAQVITLSTLREMMKNYAPIEGLDEAELDGLATVAAQFYDLLAQTRHELGLLPIQERRIVRTNLIVDTAVMMYGYSSLMQEYNDLLSRDGQKKAYEYWSNRLTRIKSDNVYAFGTWEGDLFAKKNPLWQKIGVVKPGKEGKKLTVMNTGAVKSECARVLKQLLSLDEKPEKIDFLVHR